MLWLCYQLEVSDYEGHVFLCVRVRFLWHFSKLFLLSATDGGRMGLALFGRPGKLVIGNIILLGVLFSGLVGSDLFLFYFSFIIAFQTGNEIPSRNEVDELSFPRILVATLAYCISILALVPFQQ